MNLGFFTMPIHPLDKDWRLSLKEDREAFLLADELGFTEAYVGEHVTDKAENITSCIAFLAWIAPPPSRSSSAPAPSTCRTPIRPPSRPRMAMLDHMLDGRLIFGISPGGLLSDAELFGNLDADRNAMFLESINQVLEIWAGEPPYNFKGKYWNISTQKTLIKDIGQGFIAKPLQRPHPPIVVTAVAPFSKGVTEAAARGWDPISANFLMPAWVKSHWPKYVEGCERGGRPADPAQLARRQERLCRQGRGDGKSLRHRSGRALRLLLSLAVHQTEDERPHRAVQDPPRPARRRSDAGNDLRQADHLWNAGKRRGSVAGFPGRGRQVRHAACTPARTGRTASLDASP